MTNAIDIHADAIKRAISDAESKAKHHYILAVHQVLNTSQGLDHYVDAMGDAFFVKRDGNVVYEENELPENAQKVLQVIAPSFFNVFGSLGMTIYRDHIVTDW